MKLFLHFALLLLAATCVFAETNADEHEWKATLKVVDENGVPVAGANAGWDFIPIQRPQAWTEQRIQTVYLRQLIRSNRFEPIGF